jgi:hypothetical protein
LAGRFFSDLASGRATETSLETTAANQDFCRSTKMREGFGLGLSRSIVALSYTSVGDV